MPDIVVLIWIIVVLYLLYEFAIIIKNFLIKVLKKIFGDKENREMFFGAVILISIYYIYNNFDFPYAKADVKLYECNSTFPENSDWAYGDRIIMIELYKFKNNRDKLDAYFYYDKDLELNLITIPPRKFNAADPYATLDKGMVAVEKNPDYTLRFDFIDIPRKTTKGLHLHNSLFNTTFKYKCKYVSNYTKWADKRFGKPI
ncbi:MAG: hypothetical protein HN857_03825 [Gammaproteobacteria bacterium]|jgi:hypothetical protein|nr:hypothetical protein [Gammaproteobacteria bacterium]